MITGIIGMDRGGTSAVAAVVASLGVQMYGHERTLDDRELWTSFGKGLQTKELVAKRGGDWAWKIPYCFDADVEEVMPHTDQYLLVFRDPVARACHSKDLTNVTPERVRNGMNLLQRIALLYKTGKPVCYVSYEKLLTKTPETVALVADFLHVPYNEEAVAAVNHQKGYEQTQEVSQRCYN